MTRRPRPGLVLLMLPALLACDDNSIGDEDGISADATMDVAVCRDDPLGPGRRALPAARLSAGDHPLVLCPGVQDWFSIAGASPLDTVHVGVEAGAELTVELRSETGPPRRGHGRSVELSTLGGALVGLWGAQTRLPYRLQIEVRCPPDALEPNDRPDQAALIGGASLGGLTTCGADQDWFSIESAAGERVRVTLRHDHGPPLQARLLDARGALELDRWTVSADAPEGDGALAASLAASEHRLQIRALEGRPGRYTLLIAREPVGVIGQRGVFLGRVQILDRPVGAAGAGPPIPMAGQGLTLDVVRGDGAVVAVGSTDAEGAFRLPFEHAGLGPVQLRLLAQTTDGAAPIRVTPLEAPTLPWSQVLAEAAGDGEVSLGDLQLSPEAPATPAFHVARVIAGGLAALDPLLPRGVDRASLRIEWSPERAASCGTCFVVQGGPAILLSGRPSDPDQWDDDVLLHELTHFVLRAYGHDDSPGGPHDGSPTDPRLAWSEGFATFHAAWQRGVPVLFDARAAGVRRVDLEALDDPESFATADGTLEGDVSEALVAALLWDLFDAGAEPGDDATLPPDVLIGPVFGELAVPDRLDRGVAGIDLVDHLDASWCRARAAGLGTAALQAVIAGRDYPYPSPPACPASKPRPPLIVRQGAGVISVRSLRAGFLELEHGGSSWAGFVSAGQLVTWIPPAVPGWIAIRHRRPGIDEALALPWGGARRSRALHLRVRGGAVEASW